MTAHIFLVNRQLIALSEVAAARWAALLGQRIRADADTTLLARLGTYTARELVDHVARRSMPWLGYGARATYVDLDRALGHAALCWIQEGASTQPASAGREAPPTDEAALVSWAMTRGLSGVLDLPAEGWEFERHSTVAEAAMKRDRKAAEFLASQASLPFRVDPRVRPEIRPAYSPWARALAQLSPHPVPASHAIPHAILLEEQNGVVAVVSFGRFSVRVPLSELPPERRDIQGVAVGALGDLRLAVAIEAILDLLAWPAPRETPVLDAALKPDWTQVLRALQPSVFTRTTRLVFDIEPERSIQARLQKPRKDGQGFTPGQAIDLHQLRYHDLDDDERALVGRLAGSGKVDWSAANLRVLVGYPYLRWRDAPCTVDVAPLRVAAVPRTDGGVAFDLRVGERSVTPRDLEPTRAGDLILLNEDAARITVVDVAPRLKVLIAALRKAPGGVPAEGRQAVLDALAVSGNSVGVDVVPALLGASVDPDLRVLVRLTPRPDGLDVAFVVRPLEGAGGFPPGRGPPRLAALRGTERVHTDRDLLGEVAAARALIDSLLTVEDAAALGDDFTLTVRSVDRAADLVFALQERRHPVEWPAGSAWKVQRTTPQQLRIDVGGTPASLHVRGEVRGDDATVALVRLLEASREGRRWVALDAHRFVAVADDLRAHLAALADAGQLPSSRSGAQPTAGNDDVVGGVSLAIALEGLEALGVDVAGSRVWTGWRERLKQAAAVDDDVPRGVEAELRPYQRDGLRFLRRLVALGAGGVLADDMGLGKTLQTIALLVERAQVGPQLVVAPTSVVSNWRTELARFSPGLVVHDLADANRGALLSTLAAGDVVLASYGVVMRATALLSSCHFATLVLDEAQHVKNADSQRARAVRALHADVRIALSGTPLENHTGELWSIFAAVAPGLLPSADDFRARFQLPIDRDRDVDRRRALARLVRPFLLRRTKAEVAPELPPRTEITLNVALSPEERARYDALRRVLAERARDGSLPPQQRRVQILSALTRLRQLACHAALDDVGRDLADRPSSKLQALASLLTDLKDNRHRALVFSQFTRLLDLVEPVLSAAGLSFVRLDGSTTAANRARAVEAFQSGAVDVFLLSLKAGGFGLNLTAADYVVHLDPWWNPAAEAQATDRAHRIGQTRPVTVYRLVASGTIEDAVVQMQADKRALFSAVLDGEGTHAAGARWTEDELLTLLAGADAARTENDDDDDGTSVPPTMPAPASMESPARSSAESPATSSTESPATSSHARGRKPRKAKAPLYSGGHLQ